MEDHSFNQWFLSWNENYYQSLSTDSFASQLPSLKYPRKHLFQSNKNNFRASELKIYVELQQQNAQPWLMFVDWLEVRFNQVAFVDDSNGANFILKISKTLAPLPESFELQVREDKIVLAANDLRSIWCGCETLKSLISHYSASEEEKSVCLPAMAISDSPRIHQRAVLLSFRNHLQSSNIKAVSIVRTLFGMRINAVFLLFDSVFEWELAADAKAEAIENYRLFSAECQQYSIELTPALDISEYVGRGLAPSSPIFDILAKGKAERLLILSAVDSGNDRASNISHVEAFQSLVSNLVNIPCLTSLIFALNEKSRDLLTEELEHLHFPMQVYDLEDIIPRGFLSKPIVIFKEFVDSLWQSVSDALLEDKTMLCFPLCGDVDFVSPQLPILLAAAFFSFACYAGERFLHLLDLGNQEQLMTELLSLCVPQEDMTQHLHTSVAQHFSARFFQFNTSNEVLAKYKTEQLLCSFYFTPDNLQLSELPSKEEALELYRLYTGVLQQLGEDSYGRNRSKTASNVSLLNEYLHFIYILSALSRTLYFARSISAQEDANHANTAGNGGTASEINPAQQKRAAVYDNVDMTRRHEIKVHPKTETITKLLINVVRQNILFRNFKSEEHSKIVEAFEFIPAKAGELIIKQGDSGEFFYIVESGKLDVYMESCGLRLKVGRTLSDGDYFGELALMYNTPRAATVISVDTSNLWRIDRQTYRTIVTHHNKETSDEFFGLVSNVHILGKRLGDVLSHSELSKVVSTLEIEEFENGSVIIRQHQTGDYFYIISEGQVDVWQESVEPIREGVTNRNLMGTKLATLYRGDYFGEKALLADDVRQASCVAMGRVVCLSLSRDDFIAMIGSWQDITNVDHHIQSLAAKKAKIRESVYDSQYHISLHLDDIEQLNTLGVGAFGKVKVARHKSTAQLYALKAQSKAFIVSQNMQDMILNEMHIMKQIDHPFISKLHASIQDRKYIYFLIELLPGGEFFSFLQTAGKLSEEKSRFYSASVVLALEELHKNKIAYRDLKPENMVMDGRGYVKLVDFGLAKQITAGSTWTMCGTPDYLAPEIILNKGHNYAVDYWALGVLVFEMMHGWPPFYHDQPMKVYEKIILGKVDFPASFTKPLEDMIAKFLVTNPSKRLGNMKGGINDIFKHKWYGSFDWQGLLAGTLAAPSVPDLSAFDSAVAAGADDDDESDDAADSVWEPVLV